MSSYADPERCPDCLARIGYGAAVCDTCGLPLRGQLAQELYVTLMRADQLVARLRASVALAPAVNIPAPIRASAGASAGASRGAPTGAPMGAPMGAPPASAVPSQATRQRVSATSVPKILLSLGAICLLVAALVFLVVTWSVMGVGGRTATLAGFTVLCSVLTGLVARRGLRGATEALGLVALGLLTLDVSGANHAGWLGDLSTSNVAITIGLVLLVAASGSCLALRRTPIGAFTCGEIVAGLGVGCAAIGVATGDWGSDPARLVVATAVAALLTGGLDRLHLRVSTATSAAATALIWLSLVAISMGHVAEWLSLTHLWGRDLAALPALAAAFFAGAVATLRRLTIQGRVAGLAVGSAIVAAVAVAPVLDESATEAILTCSAVLVLAAAVLWLVPRPWGAASSLTMAFSALPTAMAALLMGGAGVDRLLDAGARPGRFSDVLPALDDLGIAPWVLLACTAALACAVAATLRYAGVSIDRPAAAVHVGLVAGVATAALYPLPVWVFVLAGLAAGTANLSTRRVIATSLWLAATVAVALHSDGLTALALGGVVAAAAWLVGRDDRAELRSAAGAIGQLALAASVWTWGDLLDQPGQWVAAAGIVVVAAVALSHREVGLEIGAAVAVAGLVVPGALSASAEDTWTWVAIYLTLAGVATCAQSLLRRDRRELAWVGGLLLAMATWVRLADIGVHEPEAYTLPSAIVLLAVGLLHLRRHPSASTLTAIGPGLALGLTPSLLWALAEPGTLRSVLLGLACLVLVVAGVHLRWTAPLTYAAAAGALLVVRHATPYIDGGVPRWVLIGGAGILLVAMGITWEQRVREAKLVVGYVRSLR